ncbi:HAD family phosphatase [soil metagenome]
MTGRLIQAVVFDLDGLLIDSEPVQFAAWEAFVAEYDRELHDDLRRRMYGTRLVDSAQMVAEELQLPIDGPQVASERDALFFSMIPGNIRAKPGAVDLLGWLRSEGVRTALATSGHQRYVDLACRSAGIPRRFDVEVTGDLVERGKPDPETFVAAARLLGVPASDTLVLEDSPQGVQAAVGAGAVCFAIPDDPGNHDVDLSEAHRVVPSLAEVIRAARDYGLVFSNSSQG